MKNNIGPFSLYNKTPNDINYGAIYTLEVELPLLYYKKRIIRVYVPEDYDENNKYPLLVMSDGQNIVDRYTSAYGAWEIDKRQHESSKRFIVVGIDCPIGPSERAMEYSFPFVMINKWEEGRYANSLKLKFESHLLYEYIALTLLPLIKENFSISDDRALIGCGGSSMGGVFSLSLMLSYPDLFGYALCFSPGYFLYNEKKVNKYLDERLKYLDLNHKIYFYTGNVGFEEKFLARTKTMYEYFKEHGFDDNHVALNIDYSGEHNEYCWSKHFNDAIDFWLS